MPTLLFQTCIHGGEKWIHIKNQRFKICKNDLLPVTNKMGDVHLIKRHSNKRYTEFQ